VRHTPRSLALTFLLLCGMLCFSVPARAQSVRETDLMMDSWQLPEAKAAMDKLAVGREDSADILYLRGRYAFYTGDYAAAIPLFDRAMAVAGTRADWAHMREITQATMEVTKGYERHLSPKGRFAIYIEPGKDRVLLPFAFEALDKAYDEIGKELGYFPPTPIRLEIYPQTAVLAKVSILTEEEIRTSGTIALCKYNRLMVTSPKALLRGYPWVDTLVHEYVHYVITAKTSNRVPIWMHEGMAKYLERRWRGPDAAQLPPSSENLLETRVKQNKLITFAQMHPSMAKLPSQEDAAVAFAEVYTVMEYLRGEIGQGAFAQVLDNIAQGLEAPVAFAQVLNTTFSAFEKRWTAYLKTRKYPAFPEDSGYQERLEFKEAGAKPAELDQIPKPAARDHVHLGELLQARNRYKAAIVEYNKAIKIMGTGNPVLQTRIAQCYLANNQPREALAALEPVRDAYPSYVTTWIELGRAALLNDQTEQARDYLIEAARINPFNPEIHEQLAIAYDRLGDTSKAEQSRSFAALVQ
jgi:tetratricopeptide (TPR) repeat protein